MSKSPTTTPSKKKSSTSRGQTKSAKRAASSTPSEDKIRFYFPPGATDEQMQAIIDKIYEENNIPDPRAKKPTSSKS